jgi:hypothetical protein
VDLRVSGYVPPIAATVARRLWAEGVFSRELLEHSTRWDSDVERAWRECDRLELVLPIAIVRGAPLARVAAVAAAWVRVVAPAPDEFGWPPDDVGLLERCLVQSSAPDVDVAQLDAVIEQAIKRTADRRSPGTHRIPVLSAAAAVASLARRRVGFGFGAASFGEHVASALLATFEGEAVTLSLFEPRRTDPAAFVRDAIELARRELEVRS